METWLSIVQKDGREKPIALTLEKRALKELSSVVLGVVLEVDPMAFPA